MDTQNTSRQLRYLEEVRIPLHRAGVGTLPVEGDQLPVLWNGAPLCRITGKGSAFYRREDAATPQAEDALYRVEDIAAKTLELWPLWKPPRSLKPADWMATTASSLTLAARCWRVRRANTAFNLSHGIGTMTARACPTGTISWRNMTKPLPRWRKGMQDANQADYQDS